MSKKNDQKLCWSCDGSIALHLERCPYCGVDLSKPRPPKSTAFSSVWQTPNDTPYGQNYTPTNDEWNQTLDEGSEKTDEEESTPAPKGEMVALLLLLPGVVFFLFGLALIFFSKDGVLTLRWNQSFALFYFLGAVPLLFLGWRALR